MPPEEKSEELRPLASSEESKNVEDNHEASQPDEKKKAAKSKQRARKKEKPVDKFEKKYSIPKETAKSVVTLKDDIVDARHDESKGLLDILKAIVRFFGRTIYIIFRTLWRLLVYIAVGAVACLSVGLIGLGALFVATVGEVPELQDCTLIAMPQDSAIYDRDGELIGVITTSSRQPVASSQISQPAKDAIVSIEDERFYNHEGIDFWGIGRSLKENFESWRNGGSATAQGASTITQQYVRNAYANVGSQQTISRKLTEMVLAAELESTMSKDDILTSYLNTIFYGDGCYGIEAASQHFFGHSASTLNYYESALLAAAINSPTKYNLATAEGRAATKERADLVLDKMYALGKLGDLTQEDLRELKKTNVEDVVHIVEKERVINHPYYYDFVMSELTAQYSLEEINSGGWQIYTTLSIADGNAATERIKEAEDGQPGITGAIVDVDVKTGAINAFCGGTNYDEDQFNIATSAKLQTGSTLKPILYSALCEYDGYYMTDTMACTPINVAGDNEEAHVITPYISGGSASLEEGIIQSDNAMAIHAANELGMEKMNKMMKNLGFEHDIEQNTIAVIGGQTEGFSPLEMATAYASIGNKGTAHPYWCIKSINDSYGNSIYEHKEKSNYAMSEEVALQVTHSMVEAANKAGWYDIPFDKDGWEIAAKTGSTDDDENAWCVGFDTTRSVVVWLGGRNEKTTVVGSSGKASRILSNYYYSVATGDTKEEFKKPQYKTTIPTKGKNETLSEYMENVEGKRLQPEIAYANVTEGHSEGDVLKIEGENTLVDRGSKVSIVVAKGQVIVPDFANVNLSDVYKVGEGLDITYNISLVESGNSNPTIVGQSIEAGTTVAKGEPIILDVEVLAPSPTAESLITQIPTRNTPSVLDLLKEERDALSESNRLLQNELNYWKNQAENNIKAQVPDVTGLNVETARKILMSVGLSADYSGDSSQTVVSISPAAGSQVDYGTTVRLVTLAPQHDTSQSNANTAPQNTNELINNNTNTNTNAAA